jgi:hypothetical protein
MPAILVGGSFLWFWAAPEATPPPGGIPEPPTVGGGPDAVVLLLLVLVWLGAPIWLTARALRGSYWSLAGVAAWVLAEIYMSGPDAPIPGVLLRLGLVVLILLTSRAAAYRPERHRRAEAKLAADGPEDSVIAGKLIEHLRMRG